LHGRNRKSGNGQSRRTVNEAINRLIVHSQAKQGFSRKSA
jgi:hypothetical protein